MKSFEIQPSLTESGLYDLVEIDAQGREVLILSNVEYELAQDELVDLTASEHSAFLDSHIIITGVSYD